jgi:hypothetical protein
MKILNLAAVEGTEVEGVVCAVGIVRAKVKV